MTAASILRATKTADSVNALTGCFVTVDITGLGVISGDQLAVAIELREPPTTLTGWRAPAGWTLRQNPTMSSGSAYVYTAKYGTDVTGTSWTWDNGAGNTTVTRWAFTMLALNGTKVGALLASNAAAVASSSTAYASGSVTPGQPAHLCGFVGARITGGTTWTWPAGWVKETEDATMTATNAVSVGSGVYDTTPAATGTYSVSPTSSVAAPGFSAILAWTDVTVAGNSGSATAAYTESATAAGAAWSESFEAGTAGAQLTAVNTTFTAVDPGFVFASAPNPAKGLLAAQVDVPSNGLAMLRRTRAAAPLYFLRFYMQMPALPGNANGIAYIKTGSTVLASVRINTDGTVALRDGSTTRWTSTALKTNQWVRVAVMVDTTNLKLQARLFTGTNLHGTTADQDSGLQTLTAGNPTQITVGIDNGPVGSWTLLLDEVAESTSAWVGPVVGGNAATNGAVAGWLARVVAAGSFAVPTTVSLLARTSPVVPTGVLTTQYVSATPAANTTYDLRGAEFQGYFFADSLFGFGTFANGAGGTNATPHQLNNVPIEIGGNSTPASGLAVVGGKVIGDQPTTLTWEQMKHGSPTQSALDAGTAADIVYATVIVNNQNQDGDPRIHVANQSWAVVDGLRCYNTHDGLGLQGAASSITADSGRVWVRNVWVQQCHDDAIENDLSYLQLNVDDCLFEDCFSFISTRAGITSGLPDISKPQRVNNSVISLMPRNGPHKQPSSVSAHGHMYKSQDNSPGFVVSNTIFAISAPATSTAGTLPNRPGLDSYSNVTIVWLGAGAYPYAVPPGCTVTTDASVVTTAIARWKRRHGVTDFTTVNTAQLIAPVNDQLLLAGAVANFRGADRIAIGPTQVWP